MTACQSNVPALLTLCEGNSGSSVDSPHSRPVGWSASGFFLYISLVQVLNKWSRCRRFWNAMMLIWCNSVKIWRKRDKYIYRLKLIKHVITKPNNKKEKKTEKEKELSNWRYPVVIQCITTTTTTNRVPILSGIQYATMLVFCQIGEFILAIMGSMMALWYENTFSITGPLWWDSTGHQYIPIANSQWCGVWCFLWCQPGQNRWTHGRVAGVSRRLNGHISSL